MNASARVKSAQWEKLDHHARKVLDEVHNELQAQVVNPSLKRGFQSTTAASTTINVMTSHGSPDKTNEILYNLSSHNVLEVAKSNKELRRELIMKKQKLMGINSAS
jgi:hypothetical protein